ncbi:MAG: relaxase/mobilization nuclease domain-containing protein [Lachnospiraceae bacterium]|nr:relaxase/mobilization nuclease domain-containing protein [Lachnospiraceae bacterium]MBQ8326763.1 relaxase/mobilization nuclease domain-containing protein [Lachnospiraceae bacterium]
MAILKHISVKNRFYSSAVEYLICQFDEYTNKPVLDEKDRIQERENYLIAGVNCDVDSFGAECIEVNRLYGKNNSVKDVKAHHYIISFEPNDPITMEQALEFGKQWLDVFAPGHQAVVAVHPDGHNGSQNMHVHMVINSVRKYAGKQSRWHDKPCEWKHGCKHKSTGKMMFHAKKWVMEKCIRLGFGQVDLLAKKHTDNYWVEKRLMNQNAKDGVGVTSNRELVRDTIDKLLPFMDSFEQLVECLQFMYSWKIRVTDKTVTFSTPEMKKGIRGNKLGEGYGKAELVARIAKVVAERNAEKEARRIAEEEARLKAEALAREEAARKEKQLQEERKQIEILSRKRKLAYQRNKMQMELYSTELDRKEWNKDYVAYLESEFIRDAADLSEEELTASIMTREEFERQQALELHHEKASRAGEVWDMVLNQLSGSTHKWKWDYMDYLEGIKYRDIVDVTLEDAKKEILSYEEFAELKVAEEEIQVQDLEMVAIPIDTMDETKIVVVSEDVDSEIIEMEEAVSEKAVDVQEVIDYTKFSLEERAALLPVPMDDYEAEYDAYCQRMSYTADKMMSIRYKMAVYDEFLEEYNYRKKHYGVKDDLRSIAVSEKNRGTR